MPKAKPTYEQLNNELEAILADLQREDLDVDEALRCYQRGLEVSRQLETYLKTAENKVRQLKAKFDAGAP
ncbi:MAG TPA: exodeoxyribonuclease VII small subunit [Candidatus Saccharimonadales bacterium]|nr:exodeoxyribonuclease VII small subunit [Candidatus Saccharimonadales bacterium]